MRKLVVISIVFILSASLTSGQLLMFQKNQENYSPNQDFSPELIYRVYPALQNDDLPRSVEIVGGQPNTYHDIIFNENYMEELTTKGYLIEPVRQINQPVSQSIIDQYYTFDEIEMFLENTLQQYPEITNLFTIGKSYEDRDIWCLEISDNPGIDEEEPGILFMGLHHAREWPTVSICISLIEKLTADYDNNQTIKNLVENRRIWIIPCVNPDGYAYDHDETQGRNWWRKNRHYLPTYDTYGIDLNRNYAGSTNADSNGMWGSLGMSHFPSNDLYCGSSQFSELETQAIQQFFISHNLCACISWHTYSELVLWPWGYSCDVQAPDAAYMGEVGIDIASRISKQDETGSYTPTQASGLYPTAGDTTDWMYGYSHYVLGKTVFAYTIEACSSFHPDPEVLTQVCKENVDGALFLLEEAETINKLQPRVLPPTNLMIHEHQDNAHTLNWTIANPASLPTKYKIQELSESQILTDDANELTELWEIDGFSITTAKSYSTDMSYTAHTEDNTVSSMTTKYPIEVSSPMQLSFYCWYDIEKDWDKAFVEISKDNRNYVVLDTFTGKSDQWNLCEYSLDAYQGKSVFIRFRYSTDDQTTGEGFFIDAIYPLIQYNSISIIENEWDETSIDLSEKPHDDFFYRVSGYNDVYGWGDWSMVQSLNTSMDDNYPPSRPLIQGNQQGKPGESYAYSIMSTDPENEDIYFYISWGDGEVVEWIGPYASGTEIIQTHSWDEENTFTIQVRAKDIYDMKSEWATLKVIMPKTNVFNSRIYEFLTYHPDLRELWENIFSLFNNIQ
jgi:carboxypeptidase T